MAPKGRSNFDTCPWDQPDAPARPHQLPYSPFVDKKGLHVYILRMNREINRQQLQRGLFQLLKDHVLIIHLSVEVDLFGNVNGHIQVPGRSDVRLLVRRFQKVSFYGRTIEFSEISPNMPLPIGFRRAVVRIFEEKRKSRFLLVELLRLFEDKYDQTLSVMDIMKMPDLVERYVEDGSHGAQMIRLLPSALSWQSNLAHQGCLEDLQLAYCTKHCGDIHMAQSGARTMGSCYRVSLKEFAPRVRRLLQLHGGNLSLNSFVLCYEAQFGLLHEDDGAGSYLEHLLSSIAGVDILQLPYETRKLVLDHKSESEDESGGPCNQSEFRRFRREVYDMMVIQRRSSIQFGEFVQSYRMNYGKLCRVADFGCTRLADLLKLLSDDIHVIGVGINRVIMLSHAAQLRRFKKLLGAIRRVSGVANISKENFAVLYKITFKQEFVPNDFGVSFVEDLLEHDSLPYDLDPVKDERFYCVTKRAELDSSGLGSQLAESSGFESSSCAEKPVLNLDIESSPPASVFDVSKDESCLIASSEPVSGQKAESLCREESAVAPKLRFESGRLALRFY